MKTVQTVFPVSHASSWLVEFYQTEIFGDWFNHAIFCTKHASKHLIDTETQISVIASDNGFYDRAHMT